MGQSDDPEEGQDDSLHIDPDVTLLTLELVLADAPSLEERATIEATYNALPPENRDGFLRYVATSNERLRLMERDPLTELYNRRKFGIDLDLAVRKVNRTIRAGNEEDVSLIFLDLDYFKNVNDAHGHDTGNRVLREVTDCLQKNVRPTDDSVYRLGGDEFAAIIRNTSKEHGLIVANRLLGGLRTGSPLWYGVTASIGVVNYTGHIPLDNTVDTAVRLMPLYADSAAYFAKTQGRDRVCVYEPGVTPLKQ